MKKKKKKEKMREECVRMCGAGAGEKEE